MRKLLWLPLYVASLVGQEQAKFDEPVKLEPIERFDGPVTVRAGSGGTRAVRVRIRTWGIPNRQRVVLPEQGYVVVRLMAGDLTTVSGEARQQRKEGDFWTVPAGQQLMLETGRDTVTLSVLSISE